MFEEEEPIKVIKKVMPVTMIISELGLSTYEDISYFRGTGVI